MLRKGFLWYYRLNAEVICSAKIHGCALPHPYFPNQVRCLMSFQTFGFVTFELLVLIVVGAGVGGELITLLVPIAGYWLIPVGVLVTGLLEVPFVKNILPAGASIAKGTNLKAFIVLVVVAQVLLYCGGKLLPLEESRLFAIGLLCLCGLVTASMVKRLAMDLAPNQIFFNNQQIRTFGLFSKVATAQLLVIMTPWLVSQLNAPLEFSFAGALVIALGSGVVTIGGAKTRSKFWLYLLFCGLLYTPVILYVLFLFQTPGITEFVIGTTSLFTFVCAYTITELFVPGTVGDQKRKHNAK